MLREQKRFPKQLVGLMLISICVTWAAGCRSNRSPISLPQCEPCQQTLQQIEYPDLDDISCEAVDDIVSQPPLTISNFQELPSMEITIDEAVRLALQNSRVMQKLGGLVVNSPQAATTLVDQAIIETNPLQSVEASLSAFDAQFDSSLFFNHSERKFNNVFFGGGAPSTTTDSAAFRAGVTKQTASGASFSYRNITDYNRNDSPANLVPSTWDIVNQVEVRQPLRRGAGSMVNRIAGPNPIAGNYNGVLISRLRSDISLADFEAAVRDLVRDVENNYWELYFAYRDLGTKLAARDAARETWENRKLRFESGISRPDDEAQARQQFLTFQLQAQNALVGVLNGQPGVLGAERNLRRLLGLKVNDGQILRPVSEPATAPTIFDWDQSQYQALDRRVEIRRQRWTIRQRELELVAAKALNKWRLDLVGQYGFRGFGDNLFGSRSRPEGSAFDDLINGDLDDWQVGFEWGGPIGNRQGHLAVKNAELSLAREKTLLREQQRQILHDLGAAFVEVDRSMNNLKTTYNSRVAVLQELEPKRMRAERGQDQIFFLLDAQQRAATAESSVHRAIVDYNQALLNYAYNAGSLLARYNIQLTEGPWDEASVIDAQERAYRYPNQGPHNNVDVAPVSRGPLEQVSMLPSLDGPVTNESIPFQSLPATSPVESNPIDSILPSESAPSDVPAVPETNGLELTPPSSNPPVPDFGADGGQANRNLLGRIRRLKMR